MSAVVNFDTLPVENYLPADLVHNLDNTGYFDQHPRVRCTHLDASAPPFRPAHLRRPRMATRGFPASPRGFATPTLRQDVWSATDLIPEVVVPDVPRLLFSDITSGAPPTDAMRLCSELIKFMTPSGRLTHPRSGRRFEMTGPRLSGEGTEELTQGITHTFALSERVILVQMTLLVAGFIIGPSGESVRNIMAETGAGIYSYTEFIQGRKCRVFYVEGSLERMRNAINVIKHAIVRYKELAEGMYNGFQVDKKQEIMGIDFYYQPPPRRQVPFAAALRVPRSERARSTSSHNRR